jgi:ferritin-like metal-binding protein YciE
MLAAAQSVEHYEISRYGTLIAWAEKLGMDDATRLLEETLAEEKATDEKLTRLAESEVNIAAEETEREDSDAKPRGASGHR